MRLALAIAVAAAVFVASVDARAVTLPGEIPDFEIEVTSSVGLDELTLTPTLIDNGDGTFSAVGSDAAPSFSVLFDLTLNPDPFIGGNFTLRNLSGTTQTFTLTATLGATPIGGPTTLSGSQGEATFTDTNDSASVVLASTLFYQAQIDGAAVESQGNFSLEASGEPGISGTTAQGLFGPEAGPGVGSSIGVAFSFSLTAGDTVEVPFEFAVVPEPGLALLFAVAGAVFLARTARIARR